MLNVLVLILGYFKSNLTATYLIIAAVLYFIYYLKYRFYIFQQKKHYTIGKHRIGKTLPAHPNGWFLLIKSAELKKGATRYIDAHGESIAVFRANNNKVYAVGAFCPHLGANLGITGKVINDSCIQCPFHAWTFDGETGNCVIGKDLKQKEGIRYEYTKNGDEVRFEETCNREPVKIKKYRTLESYGYIYAYFTSDKAEEGKEPSYKPFDVTSFTNRLEHRGTSLNIVKAHCSDIAENGGDVLHFIYIHSEIIPLLVQGYWDANWLRGDDPQLKEKMKHDVPKFNDYRMNLLDTFLTEENKKHIGVIHLDNKISILGLNPRIGFFVLTGFQVGPGIVYLFIKSNFFETFLIQHIQTKEKYNQEVYHEIYCNYMAPYWFSALQLRLEVRQVLNDGVIWDNKKFGYRANFNLNNQMDKVLINWRQWYSQFYKGCKEEEETKCVEW